MPAIKHFIVTRVQQIEVVANDLMGATSIANEAFETNLHVDKGVGDHWGHTVTRALTMEINVKEKSHG